MLNVIIKVLVIIVLLEFTILYGAQVYDEYMFWAEYAYVVASFVSKGLLVIIVSVGATTQPGGD